MNYSIFYEPAYYSFRMYDIEVWQPDEETTTGRSTLKAWIFDKLGNLQMNTDPLDLKFTIDFKKVPSYFYTEFDAESPCSVETGCPVSPTSLLEVAALTDFFKSMNGKNWRFNYNWLVGDPCTNHWFGVYCNAESQVVALHFFENHL